MAEVQKKRKRTGKQREEAKKAAMAAAAAAKSGAHAPETAVTKEHEPTAEPDVSATEPVQPQTAGDGDGGDAGAEDPQPSKKRKRTGKMREEAKRLAIQRRLEAEAAAATSGEVKQEAVETVDFESIAQRIPPALKKLHPVFKQAKKAETMRLIKKIRFLKSKGNDTEAAELEAQLKFLSVIQLNAVATTHLRQKLKKHHTLKHVVLPDSITALLPVTPSVAASSSSSPDLIVKVENRLCSSKQVADAIKPVVSWVLSEPGATLSVSASKQKKETKKRATNIVDEDSDEGSMGDEEDEAAGPVTTLDSDDEVVVQDKAADEAGWESGDLGEDDEAWESGSGDAEGYNIAPPSDSDDSIAPPPAKKSKAKESKEDKTKAAKPTKPMKEEKPKATGSSSMFLPSLAAGFTAGGDSDSDPDMDYDPSGTIGTKAPPRKNRRGQRARQAIWEKKYGKGAKHVIKAREEAEAAKRGPQGQKRDGGWGGRSAASAPAPAQPAPRAAPAPPPVDEKKVHPSWEAAKARKAREMATQNAPKATKIVFD